MWNIFNIFFVFSVQNYICVQTLVIFWCVDRNLALLPVTGKSDPFWDFYRILHQKLSLRPNFGELSSSHQHIFHFLEPKCHPRVTFGKWKSNNVLDFGISYDWLTDHLEESIYHLRPFPGWFDHGNIPKLEFEELRFLGKCRWSLPENKNKTMF